MNSKKENVLIIDDIPDTLEVIRRNLESKGFRVFTATNVIDAIKILESTPVQLVITDYKMPRISGLDLITHVRENYKNTKVMMITGYATIEGAVKAVKEGAEEYLAKPFTDEELFFTVEKILKKQNIQKIEYEPIGYKSLEFNGILGKSDPINKIKKAISKAATTSATVLITGESGTGKELIARAIHYISPRISAPFVPVNCGGIPDGLLESELFGHVKGAFTGAIESRAGFFQTAEGGTIFLDEISEMSLSMQVKLLRILQDKIINMVGSNKAFKVDTRIIAATNKDLRYLVDKGAFRNDLFYRLNVITIDVKPLRERNDDILILAHYFLKKFAKDQDKKGMRFSDNALQTLKKYNWPGNVRELENVIQRLVVMNDGKIIDTPDFPELMRFSALRKSGFYRSLAEVETEYIQNVLANVDGNKTQAAKILNIDRKTLREKLKRL
jgi:DNA-binding NtrC family response regulator